MVDIREIYLSHVILEKNPNNGNTDGISMCNDLQIVS